MKAKELALNDYVLFNGDVYGVTCVGLDITSIQDVSTGTITLAYAKDLRPISLTAEMVRENWFEVRQDLSGALMYFSLSRENITVHAEENHIGKHPIWHITVNTAYNNKPCVVQMDIDYVHELQHILRLVDAPFEFTL